MECSDADCDHPVHAVGCGVSRILAASVIPAVLRHTLPLRHSREGGNPVLPRRMGPRIREDDKKGLPFPSPSVIPAVLRHSPTSQSQKGRQDIGETVGTHCAPCTVEGVLRCAQQPGRLCAANIWHLAVLVTANVLRLCCGTIFCANWSFVTTFMQPAPKEIT